MYKVLMYGGVDWSDWDAIENEMDRLVAVHGTNKLLIITGGAPGADHMSAHVASRASVHCAVIHALWHTRHKAAGPQRNSVMVALEPDEAIAFGGDRGTADTTKKLRKAGIEPKLVAA